MGLLEQVEEAPVELLVSAFLLLLKPLKEGKASHRLSNTLFYIHTFCDVTTTGWREHHPAATKPSDLMKGLPGRHQFYRTKVGILR